MSAKRRPAESVETLRAEHHAIEARLAELERHKSLSTDEQAERSRLKNLKLATKDRLARLSPRPG